MALKFGLKTQKKPPEIAQGPAVRKTKFAFGDDSDEDDSNAKNNQKIGGLPSKSFGPSPAGPHKPPHKPGSKAKLPVSQFGDLSSLKSSRKNAEAALEVDPSIFDYDAAYDKIHAQDSARKETMRVEAEQRQAKYMDSLLASAEVRKKDLLRAKDKQLQREREAEGEEFIDKEKFVTGAYKQQQEEVRKAEAEEKLRLEAEEKKKKSMGMQGFYKSIMEEKEKRYQESVAAAEEAGKAGLPIIQTAKEKTDIEIAEEMKAKGTNVLVNEDGQIVDKRQLLSAGLNIIKKSRPAPGPASKANFSAAKLAYQGKGTGQQASRERQTRMLEAQLELSAKRAADDEAEEQRKLEHIAKSKKTEGEIGSAKERYLARKKAAAEAAIKDAS